MRFKKGFSFKKTVLAIIIALGLSGTTSAAMYEEPCIPPNVGLPCQEPGWSAGASYLLVKPTSDGLPYAQSFPGDFDALQQFHGVVPQPNTITGKVKEINPGFNSSGLKFEASYFFGYGEDFSAEWTRIFRRTTGRNTNGATIAHIPGTIVDTPSTIVGTPGTIVDIPDKFVSNNILRPTLAYINFTGNINAEASLANDEVNLEWGHKALWNRWLVRGHFGVSYARVEAILNTNTQGIAQNGKFKFPVSLSRERSRFNGFGPRLGVDSSYILPWYGLILVGHGAVALYAGQIDLFSAIADGLVFQNLVKAHAAPIDSNLEGHLEGPSTNTFTTRKFVPALKGQLGVSYEQSTSGGNIVSGEIGYQWAAFFNSIRTPGVSSSTTPVGNLLTPSATNLAGNLADFGYHGVYLNFKYRACT